MSECMIWHVPLTKAYTTTDRGEKQYILEGIASDEQSDQQGEQVIQRGMDFAPLLRSGIINWDHKDGPENIIGEPLGAEIKKGSFWVRGRLYVESVDRARSAWELAQAMEASGGKRQLGWSVEGEVLQRSGRQITRSEVRNLALTHQPVNGNTWAAIAKSMASSTAPAIELENLDQTITSVLWGDCAPGKACYNRNGTFKQGRGGMLKHLHLCKGMPIDAASALIKRLIDSGLK